MQVITDKYSLFQGDCLEVMKDIPDKSIDMILCDLPYSTTQNHWDTPIPLNDYVIINNKKIEKQEFYIMQSFNGLTKNQIDNLWKREKLDGLWTHYNRIIKDNGAIVLTSQGAFTAELILSNKSQFKYKIVWEKSKATNFLNAKKQPLRKHEDICVFYKKQPTYNPQMTKGEPYNKGFRKDQLTGSYGDFKPVEVKSEGLRYPTDVRYFKTSESEGKVYHSTQKPIALLEDLIKTYTNEGMTVLDSTMGSGSTGVASLKNNRKFIGIELEEKYFNIAKERIEDIDLM